MINGLEGIPGSGKSYEACAYHVLPALKAGRKVITNLPLVVDMFAAIDPGYRDLIEVRIKPAPVRGVWDATRVDEHGNGEAFELFPDGRTEPPASSVVLFGHVWDFWSDWKHPKTGQGPLFVVDECHVPMPRMGTPAPVVEWFKLHRHFNADVLLMTQSFRDINASIAGLIAMLIVCRKADILGKKGSYIRKVKGGFRGAVISTEERPYKKEFFGLYRSHTQGNSVAEATASDVVPLALKLRRFTWAFWAFTLVVCVYVFWPYVWGKQDKPVKRAVVFEPVKRIAPHPTEVLVSDIDRAEASLPPLPPGVQQEVRAHEGYQTDHDPEPFKGKGIHLTGWLEMGARSLHTFAVSDGGRTIMSLTLEDLVRAGYTFKGYGHCAGVLVFQAKARPVTCDAPAMAQGSTSRPVVMDTASGARSDGG